MRLNERIREIIKHEVTNQLGADTVIRLFGSRVDDALLGGDIDLLIEPKLPLQDRVRAECKLAARLFIKLGGRKVDVLIKDPFMPSQLVHEQAIAHGVIL